MNRTLRCSHCDEVIGVYEPMIVLDDGQPHETSRAAERAESSSAERHAGRSANARYHRDCYARLHGGDAES